MARGTPPRHCTLWTDPEATVARGLKAQFERLETFVEESHWWRYLLKCRECGQRYVYEFREEVDWADGDDPQYVTWVPVETEQEIRALRSAPPDDLRLYTPCLCKDRPKGARTPHLYWVTSKRP